jgi:hypothetical protein
LSQGGGEEEKEESPDASEQLSRRQRQRQSRELTSVPTLYGTQMCVRLPPPQLLQLPVVCSSALRPCSLDHTPHSPVRSSSKSNSSSRRNSGLSV